MELSMSEAGASRRLMKFFQVVQFALCPTMLAKFGFFVMVSDYQWLTLRANRLPPKLLSHSTPDTPSPNTFLHVQMHVSEKIGDMS
uniref:Uncharacterized protein n=1 Tax=Kalanchoe fedtschenkoi TaxID=63787 RepID=A0A7N0VDV5_KALFE